MKAADQYQAIYKFSMILDPPQMDAEWRRYKRRKQGLAISAAFMWGAAFMLGLVLISWWLT